MENDEKRTFTFALGRANESLVVEGTGQIKVVGRPAGLVVHGRRLNRSEAVFHWTIR